MSTRIPSLLEPYLALPPEASLILLTSVLGASSNWLVLRFLYNNLQSQEAPGSEQPQEGHTKILLVSFMRDFAFWRENARRLGLDLDRLAAKKKFAFVDGLSGLYLSTQAGHARDGQRFLCSPSPKAVSAEIQQAIESLNPEDSSSRVLLVIDQLDLLLVTEGEGIGFVEVGELLLELREHVHATILTLSADSPLLSSQRTTLESNHAATLLGAAHEADVVMSLRLLDSGTARDVSGVVRITAGNQTPGTDRESRGKVEERELLYFVGGDGGVKVFERGQ